MAAWQRKDTHWVWNKLNHFHRWNHVKRGVRGYQKMFFSVNEAFRRWWPPTKSRQIDGNWQWCPREAKLRLRGHHCLDRYLPLNWKGICVANIKQPGLSNPGLINSINATHQSKWASSCQQCHQSRLMVKPARDSALFTSDNLPKDIK